MPQMVFLPYNERYVAVFFARVPFKCTVRGGECYLESWKRALHEVLDTPYLFLAVVAWSEEYQSEFCRFDPSFEESEG